MPSEQEQSLGPVAELAAMLDAATKEEGCTIFDHTPEEIGLHVMENHAAIRATLSNQMDGDKALTSQDHDDKLWQVLDDVQRALAKGINGRTLAISALRTHFSAPDKALMPSTANGFLSFWYRNYRGEVSERTVIPMRVYHGATEWHPKPQWLLEAWDMEKDAVRAFAMEDMQAAPDKALMPEAAVGEEHDWRADDCQTHGEWEADPVEQLVFELSWELESASLDTNDLVTVNREKLRTIAKRIWARAITPTPVEEPANAATGEWPEKWSGDLTVGNMIANLGTLPADMRIYGAYHVIREGKPSLLRVRHPTVSRERVDGITIKSGDETVPYSAVMWSHPQQPDPAALAATNAGQKQEPKE